MPLNVENHLFTADQIGPVARIRFKGNLIRQLTDLNLKEGIFKYLHRIRDTRAVRVVLLVGNPEKIKRREMMAFLGELTGDGANVNRIARVYNAVNQLVLFIRGLNKLVLHADNGEVLTLFLNLSLACDYRIIGDKTVFQYPTRDLGLVPKGGGIYFMSRAIGTGRTLELMLSGKNISAAEALRLGIVDRVVPSEHMAQHALDIAAEMAEKPLSLIAGIKRLLNAADGDLARFLEMENDLLLECIKADDFRRCLEKCL